MEHRHAVAPAGGFAGAIGGRGRSKTRRPDPTGPALLGRMVGVIAAFGVLAAPMTRCRAATPDRLVALPAFDADAIARATPRPSRRSAGGGSLGRWRIGFRLLDRPARTAPPEPPWRGCARGPARRPRVLIPRVAAGG